MTKYRVIGFKACFMKLEQVNMKAKIRTAAGISLLSFSMSGCLMQSAGGTESAPNSVMVSEVMSICGAIVGDQAEQRINQEWSKYPEAEASRPVIEAVAESLLNEPGATAAQRSNQYKKYLNCAMGLLLANGIVN
jgi:hypothetical protein